MDNIILEGFIGSGKGAVGKKIAEALKLPLIELDQATSEAMKMTTTEIFEHFGEKFYRAEESFILHTLVSGKVKAVIVLGSTTAMMPANDDMIGELGRVYYLHISQKKAAARIAKSNAHDWLDEDNLNEQVARLYKERCPYYERIADVTIDAENMTASEIAQTVLECDKEGLTQPRTKKTETAAAKAPAKKTARKTAVKKTAKTETAEAEETVKKDESTADEKPVKKSGKTSSAAKKKAEEVTSSVNEEVTSASEKKKAPRSAADEKAEEPTAKTVKKASSTRKSSAKAKAESSGEDAAEDGKTEKKPKTVRKTKKTE